MTDGSTARALPSKTCSVVGCLPTFWPVTADEYAQTGGGGYYGVCRSPECPPLDDCVGPFQLPLASSHPRAAEEGVSLRLIRASIPAPSESTKPSRSAL